MLSPPPSWKSTARTECVLFFSLLAFFPQHLQDPGTGIQPFLRPVAPADANDVIARLTAPLGYLIGAIRTIIVLLILAVYLLLVQGLCLLLASSSSRHIPTHANVHTETIWPRSSYGHQSFDVYSLSTCSARYGLLPYTSNKRPTEERVR